MKQNERYTRWWNSSLKILSKLEPNAISIVQQLGRLDIKLIKMSKRHHPQSKSDNDILSEFDEYLTLSYLWVLGAYEISRIIHKRCMDNKSLFPQDILDKAESTKHYFERVRIPLAKLEKARRFKHTDNRIAFPRNSRKGLGWEVSKKTFITRKELSNSLLKLLETMSN